MTMSFQKPALCLLLAVLLLETTKAFVPSRPATSAVRRYHPGKVLFVGGTFEPERPGDDDDDDDEEEEEEEQWVDPAIENARQQLLRSLRAETASEDTTSSASVSSPDTINSPLPLGAWQEQLQNPPPLTSIARERLTMEVELLESLADSDEAIPELWNLWFQSRGPQAAEELTHIEGLVMTDNPAEAEALLRKIIVREGVHWVEPVNRLATLLFVQGRFDESRVLCEMVLELKPWHFGALSGMVQLCRGLKDEEGMWEYARKVMPSLESNGNDSNVLSDGDTKRAIPTRQEWVTQMVQAARTNFQRQEQSVEDAFQECDSLATCALDFDDNDAWQ